MKKYIVTILSVIVALLLSLVMTADVTSDTILSIIGGNSDFEISDFYNRCVAGSGEKSIDEDIVVVNIDDIYDRAEIAELIEQIEDCRPSVVGIDLIFAQPKDSVSDHILLSTLNRHKDNIVVSCKYNESENTIENTIVNDSIPTITMGVANLENNGMHSVIRTYHPQYNMAEGKMASFPVAIAAKIGKGKEVWDKESEYIYFSPDEYLTITPDEIGGNKEFIEGKVVLIGTIEEQAEFHHTPLSNEYPGVYVHANTLSNILHNDYISIADDTLNWILAVIFALISAYVYVALVDSNSQNITIRLLLIAFVVATIFVGCFIYSSFHICINVPKIILVVALSQLFLDIYFGLEIFILKYLVKK